MAGGNETDERTARGTTILAVEDDDICTELLRKMLDGTGYTVLYARDGLEAMQRLEQAGTVDVILLDGNLPRMSGSQMLAVLRTSRRYRNIPVILQTTDPGGSSRDSALLRLVKPFTEEALKAVLQEALRLVSRMNRPQES